MLLGFNVCYMDFYLFEMILLCEFITNKEIFKWYPVFKAYQG